MAEVAVDPSCERAAGRQATAPVAQRAAPRPPFLARNHVPCTDTTMMDTEEFLAHLKTLPWYKDQVRIELPPLLDRLVVEAFFCATRKP